jgi:hypothetical protein
MKAALTCAGGDLNIVVFEVILQNVMAVKASYAAPDCPELRVATASAPDFFYTYDLLTEVVKVVSRGQR